MNTQEFLKLAYDELGKLTPHEAHEGQIEVDGRMVTSIVSDYQFEDFTSCLFAKAFAKAFEAAQEKAQQ